MSDEAERGPIRRLNGAITGLGPSATIAIHEHCHELQRQGRRIYKLGLGQSPFPVPHAVVEELRSSAAEKAYLPTKGLPALREAVADYHRRRCGIAPGADDVLIGPGSKELMFLLQMVHDGDLIVPTPAWVSYAPQARIVGRPVRFLATEPPAVAEAGWRLRPEALDAVCREEPERARVLILNYPGNPTGGTYEASELAALADVARRHRVLVLSDEIYGELHHEGRHVSIAPYYPEGTIISGGLSKWCGAGGWRLGTFTFPRAARWLLDAMAVVASETYTSTSAPIQYAAVRAFHGSIAIERYLWNARRVLRGLGQALERMLRAAGAALDTPAGGFYLYPDFTPLASRLGERGITTSDELCRRILDDTGVAVLPGTAFGRSPDELAVRIAYVDFDGARALVAAETLPQGQPCDEDFIAAYCAPTLEAVRVLCEWLDEHGGERMAG